MNKAQRDIKINPTTIIIVLGCLNGLMPFSTDLYLPAFTSMAENLNTSVGYIAVTMSSFFAGSCIGQLINGPILDKYGRKYPMIGGLVLFCIASIWCGLVTYLEVLILMRFFQALGISMCNVGGKAVVRDIFPASQTARIFSILGIVMGIAPIISPTIGSWLMLGFGWRSIFYFLAIFSFLVILLVWYFLPDTFQKDETFSLRIDHVLRKYKAVIKVKGYLGYTIVTSFGSAVLFAWISSSSFIFIELLGLSALQFGMVFAGTASCLILSNQLNIMLLWKFRSQDIAIGAVMIELVICAYLFYVVQYNFQLITMIIGVCLLVLFLHLISTNAMAMALNKIEVNLGIASAFMGSLRMALSAVVTFVLSYFLKDSAMPMVIAIFLMSLMSLFLQFRLRKQSA